jgi:hypothetical protein
VFVEVIGPKIEQNRTSSYYVESNELSKLSSFQVLGPGCVPDAPVSDGDVNVVDDTPIGLKFLDKEENSEESGLSSTKWKYEIKKGLV